MRHLSEGNRFQTSVENNYTSISAAENTMTKSAEIHLKSNQRDLPFHDKQGQSTEDPDHSLDDLLKLTKNINNQMNWGTFGMTNVKSAPGFTKQAKKRSSSSPEGSESGGRSSPASSTMTTNSEKQMNAGSLQPTKEVTTSAALNQVSPQTLSSDRRNEPPTLFKTVINMIAVVEGGLIPVDHPEFDRAANDALYGVRIDGSSRLVYTKEDGLDIVEEIDYKDYF